MHLSFMALNIGSESVIFPFKGEKVFLKQTLGGKMQPNWRKENGRTALACEPSHSSQSLS